MLDAPTDGHAGMATSTSMMSHSNTNDAIMRQRSNVPQKPTAPPSPAASRISRVVKSMDMFPKVEEEELQRSSAFGALSLLTFAIIAILVLHELRTYFTITTTEHMVVDSKSREKLHINFNLTLPHINCAQANIDLIDTAGEQVLNVHAGVWKQPMSPRGEPIGEPYEETDHVDSRASSPSTPGCTTWGTLHVNKVGGNFHITIGKTAARGTTTHVHQFKFSDAAHYNASHRINHLSFGEKFDGMVSPLSGHTVMYDGIGHFMYTVKIIPTTYVDYRGNTLHTNQYSFTKVEREVKKFDHTMTKDTIPGVFFMYDLSSFRVRVTETSKPFRKFLTSLCAIVGGVFTISGIVASVLQHTTAALKR